MSSKKLLQKNLHRLEGLLTMTFKTSSSITGLLGVCLLLLSGCGTSGLNFNMTAQKFEKESADNPVEQIIPVWHEGEGPGTDQHVVSRGFSGQIYFITNNKGLPSEVNGKVRIYLFDDQGEGEELEKPIHQFDFDASTWKAHLTITKLGPAYSVFIPYTRPGRHRAECALRIRFTPVNGTPVFSQMAALSLEGVKKTPEPTELTKKIAVPELSKREPHSLRKVTQVSATGELVDRKSVQTAGYETPSRKPNSSGKVRLSNHEVDATDVRQAFLGDDITNLPADETSTEEMLSEGSAADVNSDSSTEVSAPSDEQDPDQTVRTYTIQLEN